MMKLLSPAQRTIAWLGILALSLGLVSCQTQCPFAPAKPTVQRIQNGVQLQAGKLNVKVQFYADDQVASSSGCRAAHPKRQAWS